MPRVSRVKVAAIEQGMGPNWETAVELSNGSAFICDYPAFELGCQIELQRNGSIEWNSSDGGRHVLNPTWTRLPNIEGE